MIRLTRPVLWMDAALKDFMCFPEEARRKCLRALTVAAEGFMPLAAKPLRGFGAGVFEVAQRVRGDAYRVVYAVQLGEAIWVVHAFQKKSTRGIKTPKHEIDLAKARLKRLKEGLG
jgi:phage-related protein